MSFQLTSAAANTRRDRAEMKISLMALWVSVTTVLTFVMMITTNFYVIYNWDTLHTDESALNTVTILIVARDLSITVTVSVNVIFYSFFCENFRDVIKHRTRCHNVTA